jgi:hypothetical protein
MRVYNKHPGTVEGVGAGQYGTISKAAFARAPWAFSVEPEPEAQSSPAQKSAGSGAEREQGHTPAPSGSE